MEILAALAVSIGLLGGIATWSLLGPTAESGRSIPAAFVAWASFHHRGAFHRRGAKEAGLQKSIMRGVFGALVGWISLLVLTQAALSSLFGVPLWVAICVAIAVLEIVLAAKSETFGDIPASFLDFASVAALALAGDKLGVITAVSIAYPGSDIAVFMAIGALAWLCIRKRVVVQSSGSSPTAAA